jgi:hypothetical protein
VCAFPHRYELVKDLDSGGGGVDERDEREREYGDSKTFLSHSWKSHPFLSCY